MPFILPDRYTRHEVAASRVVGPSGRTRFVTVSNQQRQIYFRLAGGTIPFIRRYSTSCP